MGGWGPALSTYDYGLLEITQRARVITGVVAQASPGGTLLEANLLPASVVVPTQAAALIERWRRLQQMDLRRRLVTSPLPRPPIGRGRRPYFPHPWEKPMELIRQVLEARSVPAGHPRMPILVRRRTQPSCTHHVGRVHIFSEPWNAPETLLPKDTEDGVRLRAELNRGSLAALQARYGVFDLEVWTDAGVAHAEQTDCVSAADGHLYVRSSPLPRDTFVASSGRLACSFSAEVCAFVGSLERFAPTIPPKSAVLLAVD